MTTTRFICTVNLITDYKHKLCNKLKVTLKKADGGNQN